MLADNNNNNKEKENEKEKEKGKGKNKFLLEKKMEVDDDDDTGIDTHTTPGKHAAFNNAAVENAYDRLHSMENSMKMKREEKMKMKMKLELEKDKDNDNDIVIDEYLGKSYIDIHLDTDKNVDEYLAHEKVHENENENENFLCFVGGEIASGKSKLLEDISKIPNTYVIQELVIEETLDQFINNPAKIAFPFQIQMASFSLSRFIIGSEYLLKNKKARIFLERSPTENLVFAKAMIEKGSIISTEIDVLLPFICQHSDINYVLSTLFLEQNPKVYYIFLNVTQDNIFKNLKKRSQNVRICEASYDKQYFNLLKKHYVSAYLSILPTEKLIIINNDEYKALKKLEDKSISKLICRSKLEVYLDNIKQPSYNKSLLTTRGIHLIQLICGGEDIRIKSSKDTNYYYSYCDKVYQKIIDCLERNEPIKLTFRTEKKMFL